MFCNELQYIFSWYFSCILFKMFFYIVEGEIFLPRSQKIDFPLCTNELFTQILVTSPFEFIASIVSSKHTHEEAKDSKDD